jgi:hypothetical protein
MLCWVRLRDYKVRLCVDIVADADSDRAHRGLKHLQGLATWSLRLVQHWCGGSNRPQWMLVQYSGLHVVESGGRGRSKVPPWLSRSGGGRPGKSLALNLKCTAHSDQLKSSLGLASPGAIFFVSQKSSSGWCDAMACIS